MDIFQEVKQHIPVPEAAQRYGLTISRDRRGLCPFHDDHHPSMLLSQDHYHCFACGAHGDVVDLAARLLGLSPLEAARRLAGDFGIDPAATPRPPLPKRPPAPGSAELSFIRSLQAYVAKLESWQREYAPKEPGEVPSIRFLESCRCLPMARDYLATLIEGTGADRLQALEYLTKEETAPWRE